MNVSRDDVELIELATRYQGFFRVDRYKLRHRRFDGTWSRPLQREVFARGHAAAVLPYDPVRDKVVLIEQFRVGALAAGLSPVVLEPVAGMIEDGEAPEAVARREAEEEVGCTVRRLELIGRFLTSPGGSSETITLYCGEVDSTQANGLFGLDSEDEDIRPVHWSADEVRRFLDDDRLNNATTLVALNWFARHHGDLRRRWLGQPQA